MIMLVAGISIYKHYCGDDLISTSIVMHPKHCENGHCPFCKNEVNLFELDKDFFNTSINFLDEIKTSTLFIFNNDIELINTNQYTPPLTSLPKTLFIKRQHIRELAKIQVFEI